MSREVPDEIIFTNRGVFRIPPYARRAMTERNITADEVEEAINSGLTKSYKDGTQSRVSYYDQTTNIFVATTPEGAIVTTFGPDVGERYFDALN